MMAMALSQAAYGNAFTLRAGEWFIGLAMIVLAMLKLQNIQGFATMFLNYDLLAQRWVPYGKVYPFAELGAGALMVAGVLTWVSAPVALFIGGIGAVSGHIAGAGGDDAEFDVLPHPVAVVLLGEFLFVNSAGDAADGHRAGAQ